MFCTGSSTRAVAQARKRSSIASPVRGSAPQGTGPQLPGSIDASVHPAGHCGIGFPAAVWAHNKGSLQFQHGGSRSQATQCLSLGVSLCVRPAQARDLTTSAGTGSSRAKKRENHLSPLQTGQQEPGGKEDRSKLARVVPWHQHWYRASSHHWPCHRRL